MMKILGLEGFYESELNRSYSNGTEPIFCESGVNPNPRLPGTPIAHLHTRNINDRPFNTFGQDAMLNAIEIQQENLRTAERRQAEESKKNSI